LPPLLSGGPPLSVMIGGEPLLTLLPPFPTLSSVVAGTDVTWLTTEVSAAPVGPLGAADDDGELLWFTPTSTTTITTMMTAKIEPPAM
jgi:hypothetical protein